MVKLLVDILEHLKQFLGVVHASTRVICVLSESGVVILLQRKRKASFTNDVCRICIFVYCNLAAKNVHVCYKAPDI